MTEANESKVSFLCSSDRYITWMLGLIIEFVNFLFSMDAALHSEEKLFKRNAITNQLLKPFRIGKRMLIKSVTSFD